jgi:hypothetical protein
LHNAAWDHQRHAHSRQKKAPSLAAWGKSTFSEGGGDNGGMPKKHACSDFSRIFVALQQVGCIELKKLAKTIRSIRFTIRFPFIFQW